MRKIKSILSAIILLLTFILVILLFFAKIAGQTPEIFGYQVLRISSQSMEPDLQVGDIILSHSIDDVSSLQSGDIVTYNGEFGDYVGKTITHEVVVAPHLSDGKYYLQTQGIANDSPDPEISEDSLVGLMVCRLTVFSAVYSFFITPWGLIIILGFLAIIFINEIFALRQLVKENDNETSKIETSSSTTEAEEKTNNNSNTED